MTVKENLHYKILCLKALHFSFILKYSYSIFYFKSFGLNFLKLGFLATVDNKLRF